MPYIGIISPSPYELGGENSNSNSINKTSTIRMAPDICRAHLRLLASQEQKHSLSSSLLHFQHLETDAQ